MDIKNFAKKPIGNTDTLAPVSTSFKSKNPHTTEPLVDIFKHNIKGCAFYARTDGLNAPYYKGFDAAPKQIFVRKTVADKLVKVNIVLAPLGLELFVLDGWRPVAMQHELWTHFIDKAKNNGCKTKAEQTAFAANYCSNPHITDFENPLTVPLHNTGGAVDVTLVNQITGEQLFMGGIFDDPSPVSHTCFFEQKLKNEPQKANDSDRSAMENRRILFHAMATQDFTIHHNEWWHFDFGTRYWAGRRIAQGQDAKAFYSAAKPEQ